MNDDNHETTITDEEFTIKLTKFEMSKIYLCLSSKSLDKEIEALKYELKNDIINPNVNDECVRLREVRDYYKALAEKFNR